MAKPPRRIWLCADDYGISPGVNAAHPRTDRARAAQRHLGDGGGAPFRAREAAALDTLNAGKTRAALGLHVTLTAPFAPMSAGFAPLRDGAFLPVNDMLTGGRAPAQGRAAGDRDRHAAARLRRRLRPPARLHRRPSARASVAAGARRLPEVVAETAPRPGCANAGARGRTGGCTTARPRARYSELRLPPPGQAARRRHQSGLRRRL